MCRLEHRTTTEVVPFFKPVTASSVAKQASCKPCCCTPFRAAASHCAHGACTSQGPAGRSAALQHQHTSQEATTLQPFSLLGRRQLRLKLCYPLALLLHCPPQLLQQAVAAGGRGQRLPVLWPRLRLVGCEQIDREVADGVGATHLWGEGKGAGAAYSASRTCGCSTGLVPLQGGAFTQGQQAETPSKAEGASGAPPRHCT